MAHAQLMTLQVYKPSIPAAIMLQFLCERLPFLIAADAVLEYHRTRRRLLSSSSTSSAESIVFVTASFSSEHQFPCVGLLSVDLFSDRYTSECGWQRAGATRATAVRGF
eukprot:1735460-Pleurochrysis_carterae.AAC.2